MSEEEIVVGLGRKIHWLNDRVIIEVSISPELRTSVNLNGEQFVSLFQNVIRKGDSLDLSMLDDMWYQFSRGESGLNLLGVIPGQPTIRGVLVDARFEPDLGSATEVEPEVAE